MKKIFLLFSVLVLLAASGQAQRHYVARGHGGYRGGYHSARPYYGGYGRSFLGFGLGLGLGIYLNADPYYGYAYPPPYGYGYGYAYPPGYMVPPPPQQYQYANPPADSTARAPQPGDGTTPDDGNTQGPKPTKSWIDSHWEHRSSGWVWVEGYWKYN